MGSDRVTRRDVDELLSFRAGFEVPGRKFVVQWTSGPGPDGETLVFPYPVYQDDVLAFFSAAGKRCWSDFDYDPREAGAMLEDDDLIAKATLAQLRSMLTYCVRGERFCDGHWEAMLKRGRITALLRRLAALRDEIEPRAEKRP